jgi:hypothetical protein
MMRRDKRPFVVEVKRGAKRAVVNPSVLEGLSFDDAVLRAENALFGVGSDGPSEAKSGAKARANEAFGAPANQASRRILDALPDREPVVEMAAEPEPKKRGRKPGSKNKPRVETPVAPKRRGRPPKVAGSGVRSVQATPDIINAALDTIGRSTSAQPMSAGQRTLFPQDTSEAAPPVKRGRGRPRKIIPEGGLPPRVPAWIAWSQSDDAAAEPDAVNEDVVFQPTMREPLAPVYRGTERFASRTNRPKAGLRWTRRLRGIAAYARDRRLRKA